MRSLRSLVCALVPSLVTAQANETVFVGTSVSGSADSHFFANSATGALTAQGGNTFTDNVTDAVWLDLGANLYCGQSIQPRVSRAQWNGATPTWSTFFSAPGACYGLGADRARKRLWVLTGPSGSTRELVCLDADPASASYGQVITQTTTLSGPSRERWELSPSGNLAAVPHAFLQGGLFEIVDTDPASPTFLQVVVSAPVTGASAGFALASACAISADGLFAYVLYSGLGTQGLAVMIVPSATWLDFDPVTPGQQDFAISLGVPNRMALSPDASFLAVSGQGSGGWAARIDLDYGNPPNTTLTPWLAGLGLLPNCNGVSLSADGTRAAVTATPTNLAAPSFLVLIDAQTGALLQNVTLPGAWNVYTTAWQDLRPDASYAQYGTGCAGALGVPVLAAVAGSRPVLGATLNLSIANVPQGIALMVMGFSNTVSGPFPLPLDLSPFGLPGCTLLAEVGGTTLLLTGGTTALWNLAVPNVSAYLGLPFYNQGFVLDPPANATGLTASNGGRGVVGI